MGDTLPGTINEKSSLIRMIFAPTLSALILASFSSFAVAQNATARAVLSFDGMGVGPGNASTPTSFPAIDAGPANASTVVSYFADASSIPAGPSGWGPYSSGSTYPLSYNTKNGAGSYVLNMDIPIHVIYYHNNDLPLYLGGSGGYNLLSIFLGTLDNPGSRKSSEVPTGISGLPISSWFNVLRNYYNTGYLPSGSVTPQYINNIYLGHADSFLCSWGWPGKTSSGCQTSLSGIDVQNLLMEVTNDKTYYPNSVLSDKAIYVVVLSSSITESIDGVHVSGVHYCAYHSTFQNTYSGASAIWYKYAVVKAPSASSKCMAQKGTSNDDSSDNALFFIAHEIAETITDPSPIGQWTPGAWSDPKSGQEMGDKCEQANVLQKDSNGKAYNTIIHGTKIMLPAIWDIKSQKCSMGKTYGFYIVLDNGGGIQYAVTATGLGGQLTLQPINWGSSQQWQFDNGATNNARIFNSAAPNWYCFGASMSAGTAVTQQQCTSSSTQNWIFYLSTQTIQNGAGGVNTNTNGANGGLGLTASYAGAGATLSLQWTGQSNQKWVLVPAW